MLLSVVRTWRESGDDNAKRLLSLLSPLNLFVFTFICSERNEVHFSTGREKALILMWLMKSANYKCINVDKASLTQLETPCRYQTKQEFVKWPHRILKPIILAGEKEGRPCTTRSGKRYYTNYIL